MIPNQQKVSPIRPPPHQNSNAMTVGAGGGPVGSLSPSMMSQSMVMKLPTVDEAWNLPIPTELTQRQMQLEMQEAVASASSAGGVSRIFAHHSPNYLTNNGISSGNCVCENVPFLWFNQRHWSTDIAIDPNGSKRRRITEGEELVAPLTPQQTQLLMTLEVKYWLLIILLNYWLLAIYMFLDCWLLIININYVSQLLIININHISLLLII